MVIFALRGSVDENSISIKRNFLVNQERDDGKVYCLFAFEINPALVNWEGVVDGPNSDDEQGEYIVHPREGLLRKADKPDEVRYMHTPLRRVDSDGRSDFFINLVLSKWKVSTLPRVMSVLTIATQPPPQPRNRPKRNKDAKIQQHSDAIKWLTAHLENDEELWEIVEDIRLNHNKSGQTMLTMKNWVKVVQRLNEWVTLDIVRDLVDPPEWDEDEEEEDERSEGELNESVL